MKSGVAVMARVAASARSTAPRIPPDRVNRVPAPTPRHFSAPRLEVWSSISGLIYLRVARYQTGRAAVLFPLLYLFSVAGDCERFCFTARIIFVGGACKKSYRLLLFAAHELYKFLELPRFHVRDRREIEIAVFPEYHPIAVAHHFTR